MKHPTLIPPYTQSLSHIHHFFDTWSLPSALREAGIVFQKAAGDRAWRPANPYDVVQLCRQLKKLSKAAFTISGQEPATFPNSIAVEPGEDGPDPGRAQHYMGSGHGANAFSHFPRQLSAGEFAQPARALRSYCSRHPKKYWKQFYNRLAECALSTTSLNEYEKTDQLLLIREQVFKLVEACHLIHVRQGKIPIAAAG